MIFAFVGSAAIPAMRPLTFEFGFPLTPVMDSAAGPMAVHTELLSGMPADGRSGEVLVLGGSGVHGVTWCGNSRPGGCAAAGMLTMMASTGTRRPME